MKDKAHLIGDCALAGGAIRAHLDLVYLDEVLGLSPLTVDALVEMPGLIDNFRVIDPRDFRVLKLSKYRYDYGQATPPRFALVGRYGAFDPR